MEDVYRGLSIEIFVVSMLMLKTISIANSFVNGANINVHLVLC